MTITELVQRLRESGRDVEVRIAFDFDPMPDHIAMQVIDRGVTEIREGNVRLLSIEQRGSRLPLADLALDDLLTKMLGPRRVPVEAGMIHGPRPPREGR